MTTDPTPSAVTNAVGLTPNTGSSTQMSASDHTTARMMFTMIVAVGRLPTLARSLRMSLPRACWTTRAMRTTIRK